MSQEHYVDRVWPHAFYISRSDIAKWKMNAARALGNLGDTSHIPLLAKVLAESEHENVRAMCAWALGRLGGAKARTALESRVTEEDGEAKKEIELALERA
jgi:epoxyqueuosine reductase